jgi:hypothetical protein
MNKVPTKGIFLPSIPRTALLAPSFPVATRRKFMPIPVSALPTCRRGSGDSWMVPSKVRLPPFPVHLWAQKLSTVPLGLVSIIQTVPSELTGNFPGCRLDSF